MKAQIKEKIWVAVKVERGFIIEARGFLKKADAEKQERKWRKIMNPDYDESEVLPLHMDEACLIIRMKPKPIVQSFP